MSFALAAGPFGCSRKHTPTPTPDPQTTEVAIDRAGGTVRLGGAMLVIPPGAVLQPVAIRITNAGQPAPEGQIGYSTVYRFEPAGLRFHKPVQARIAFSGDPARASLYWSRRDDSNAYALVESHVDNGVVVGEITHFSQGFVGDNNPCGRDLLKDNDNCGSCGLSCHNASHVVSCRAGVCTPECEAGTLDCDPDDGVYCEVDLRGGNHDHCGACNVVCDAHATCNQRGNGSTFECQCADGYEGDGLSCTPVVQPPIDACPAGFARDGETCVDVDECEQATHDCARYASCHNTQGGFECECLAGFEGDGQHCDDLDECALGMADCHRDASCHNTPGGYLCACRDGFAGDGTTCSDIDECSEQLDHCSEHARCENLPGGFSCECNSGYEGTGTVCTNIDECERRTASCDRHAECIDLPGSFACECSEGYTGDGQSCQDIDECAQGLDECDSRARCNNTDGGYTCACNDGFIGDGFDCRDATSKILSVHAGGAHTCVVLNNGYVRCWGWGIYGELGYGSTKDVGVSELPSSSGYVHVGAPVDSMNLGATHTCARLQTGEAMCWGRNFYGPLGLGHTRDIGDDELPVDAGVVTLSRGVVDIAAGGEHTCVLLDTGDVRCFGLNVDGQLGYGHTRTLGDDETLESLGNVELGMAAVQVVAGRDHSCALLSNGAVRCWGRGEHAPLGYGDRDNVGDDESPSARGDVNLGATATQLAAGWYHTCALLSSGAVRCWGYGALGALGYGNLEDIGDDELPQAAGDVPLGAAALQVVAGTYHTCALLSTGSVRCWGRGKWGPLGYGNTETIGDDETPQSAGDVPLGGRAVQLTAGSYHTCALLEDGEVRCWGKGQYGRLGCGHEENIGDDETPDTGGGCTHAIDVDECAQGLHSCDPNATCTDLTRGYTCTCNDGFSGDGFDCVDVDECTLGSDRCHERAECANQVGGYDCACIAPFEGDGFTCTDPNQCALDTHDCHPLATCTDRDPGFECTCLPGYSGSGRECVDIDECSMGSDDCDPDATCTNTDGGFTCECGPGLLGDGRKCRSCPAGHELIDQGCVDIDECALGLHNCEATCVNLAGGFRCQNAPETPNTSEGPDSPETPDAASCPPGFVAEADGCMDVNECDDGSADCSRDATCTNTSGSYECECRAGFQGDGFQCEDIDECTEMDLGCHPDADCINLPGLARCECHSGYAGDGHTCSDVDECADGSAQCDPRANCENTPGAYSCTCEAGLIGDGSSCKDPNQCELGLDDCDEHAHCTDLDPGFTCTCAAGYQGDGTTCTDIDECAEDLDNCDLNATCHNTEGGFACSCNWGFAGDGVTCTGDPLCQLLSGFEANSWPSPDWIGVSGEAVAGSTASAAAHDGRYGLSATTGRPFMQAHLVGETGGRLSGWVRLDGAQALASIGVQTDSAAAYLLTLDADAGELAIESQDHVGEITRHASVAVSGARSAWALLELEFLAQGIVVGTMFAEDGESPVAQVSHLFPSELPEAAATVRASGGAAIDQLLFCGDEPLVDECAQGVDNCSDDAICIDTPAGFECRCIDGYLGDGVRCARISECDDGTARCDSDANCIELPDGYDCECKSGFEGDGYICRDTDECFTQADNCSDFADCTNLPGDFACQCWEGFTGDGVTCLDVDECATGDHTCSADADCLNVEPGFECQCKPGFRGDGYTCTDIDECTEETHLCDAMASCENTPGGYLCHCPEGYEHDGSSCEDIDECALGRDDCEPNATCFNSPGSYTCECNAGFEGDGVLCQDVDECALSLDFCDPNADCTNVPGGYTCRCPVGFEGDGFTCDDVDECALNVDNCHPDAICENTPGAYTCACKPGFEGDGFACADLDECALGLDSCAFHAECINTYGSYTCDCDSGFAGDGFTCSDLDECAASGACDPNALCENLAGSFRCTCLAGFTGDGTTCSDIDECGAGTHDCSDHASCLNRSPGFDCRCHPGFAGDGKACHDVDECANASHACDPLATCRNTQGGYDCLCPAGYEIEDGGLNCNDIDECANGTDTCHQAANCINTESAYTCQCKLGFVGDGQTCEDIATQAKAVSLGGLFSCALMNEGIVRCWGYGDLGALGYGNTDRIGDDDLPATAGHVEVGGRVTALATGSEHACAILEDGRLRCWGLGSLGQLGYGNAHNIGDDETPASAGDVPVGQRVLQVAAGTGHTCAILADHSLLCFGDNSHGQLGYGHTRTIGDDETPLDAGPVSLGEPALQVTAGEQHTCVLLQSGAVRCFGSGSLGQLGSGTTETLGDDELPSSVPPIQLGEPALALSAGGDHTCALLGGGRIRCWGYGSLGRLGYGNTATIGDDETPQSAGDVSIGGRAVAVRAGLYNTCVLLEDNSVRCWGFGSYGLTGVGVTNLGSQRLPSEGAPIQLGQPATQLDVGFFHACVVDAEQNVRCWGLGAWGMLGYGNTSTIGDNETPESAGPLVLY